MQPTNERTPTMRHPENNTAAAVIAAIMLIIAIGVILA
jgi:hypothetical protein